MSDTVKNRNLELGEKLMIFEEKLYELADEYKIDTKAIRQEVKKEFKVVELKKDSSKNLILKFEKEID